MSMRKTNLVAPFEQGELGPTCSWLRATWG
jgi:hypothetical protein